MAKLTLVDLASGYGVPALYNANNERLEAALENTLSRDGSGPNEMEADLDMGGNRVLNLPDAVNSDEPITLGQAGELLDMGSIATQENVGDLLYPTEGGEVGVVRNAYPKGHLLRHTLNAGDGTTNTATALANALASGSKVIIIPEPTTSWNFTTQVAVPPGVSILCETGATLKASVAADFAFLFDLNTYDDGPVFFRGFHLLQGASGCKGIKINRSRLVRLAEALIEGDGASYNGTGVELNGGADTTGTAFCYIDNDVMIRKWGTNLLMTTDNATPFCNRNYIGLIHVNGDAFHGTGLDIDKANTNWIGVCAQGCSIGYKVGADADNNCYFGYNENNTHMIELSTSSIDNVWLGGTTYTHFVDAAGAQVTPHLTNKVLSANGTMWQRLICLPSGGAIRFDNPFGTEIRFRANDGIDQDLSLSSHDAADTNFDIFTAKYDATAPYGMVQRALVFKQTTITYSASMDTDSSLGNFFVITATNGTAFAINAPTNPKTGAEITYTIRNTFGVLGAVTWNAIFKMSAWTQPANGFSRSIQFKYNGTNWVQMSQTGVDVPN